MKGIIKIVQDRQKFATFSKDFTKEVEDCIKRECDTLEKELKSAAKSAYRTIRNIVGDGRHEFTLFANTIKGSLDQIKNHFSRIGGEEKKIDELIPINLPTTPKRLVDIKDSEFTLDELTSALAKIKPGKATRGNALIKGGGG